MELTLTKHTLEQKMVDSTALRMLLLGMLSNVYFGLIHKNFVKNAFKSVVL